VRKERLRVLVVQRAQQLRIMVADGGLLALDGESGDGFAGEYVR
jgi:hypothetical protein